MCIRDRYHNQGVSLPVGVELVAKTERYLDPESGQEKRRSTKTKNELYRNLVQQAVKNQIHFKYVLNDIWYASAENMNFVKITLKKEFVMPSRPIAKWQQVRMPGRKDVIRE